ncbi:DeoR/GlpR family DNA-binding transcription regulator [Photobacterium sagamiensis]|uniref:DeoR/GlpR family DNA-binding transcription regulator n=1 Tax=Photobacterium sagamiensis TaxID=2910241 RepID=UPI003D09DD73
MNALERREQILDLLNIHGRVKVKQLVELLEISEVTIRGDLRTLEHQGKLQRYHGGAQSLESLPLMTETGTEIRVDRRYKLNPTAKERIAIKAASYIESGSSVIFDSGSTTYLVAKKVAEIGGIIAITNNLLVADVLSDVEDVTLVMSGGTYRSKTKSLHGIKAEQCLEGVTADILFIGADGIDPEKGITTFNTGYVISEVMAQCARKVIAVADSTKITRVGYNKVLDISIIDILITDDDIDDEYIGAFTQKGIEVITV